MDIFVISCIVILGILFMVFVYPIIKSECFLIKSCSNNTEQQVIDFINGIKSNSLEDIDKVLFIYGLKKENIVKKIVLSEDPGFTLIIRGYINSHEYFEFWPFHGKEDILVYHNKNGLEEEISKERIEEMSNKYKDYDSTDLFQNIKFLVDKKDSLKII